MRIHGLSATSNDNTHTLAAKVEWENCSRPNMEVFFRTRSQESFFDPGNYNPFLVACLIPAVHYGERRIYVDGAVCPWLVDNLVTLMAYQNHWYWYDRGQNRGDTVKLEARDFVPSSSRRKARVAMFFSGGVDSLFSLRKNRVAIPEGHPGRISDAIFVHGFDFGVRPRRGTENDAFEFFLKDFEPVFRETGVNVVPVWTNLQLLGQVAHDFWNKEFMGPAMGAVAHALSGRLTDVLMASSYHIDSLHPYSAHPLTDGRLSSIDLRLHHDAERVRRVDKVAALADWPVALNHMRVCFFGEPGVLNCGTCGKCIRTKLELMCSGRVLPKNVFADDSLGVGLIIRNLTISATDRFFFDDLIRELSRAGHLDLAAAVLAKRAIFSLKKLVNVRGTIAQIDKHVLGARLKRLYRHLSGGAKP